MAEAIGYLADIAAQSPSAAHVRPWRFWASDDTVRLVLGVYDQGGLTTASARRQAVLACGAALFNLALAVGHFGVEPEIELWLDDPATGDVLALLTAGRQRPARAADERLLAAVPRRRSSRRPFRGAPPSERDVTPLRVAARCEGAELVEVVGAPRVLLDEIVEGTERRYHDPTARMGLRGAWTRSDDPRCRTLALCTREDRPDDWLSAGRALQHVLLEATCHDLDVHLHTAPLEVPQERGAVRDHVVAGLAPQVLLQLGGPPSANRAPTFAPTPGSPMP